MFTGLIEEIGTVSAVKPLGGGLRLSIKADKIMEGLKVNDSVALNGVCQTVVSLSHDAFSVEAVEETLRKTTFKNLKAGNRVNLERALKLSDRLGGHIVQGHVDCIGRVHSIQSERLGVNLWISYPSNFMRYIVNTGSICINGVSLTTARVEHDRFMVSIIPHTWELTLFKEMKPAMEVNLEFDIIGKYIERISSMVRTEKNDNTLDRYIDQPNF